VVQAAVVAVILLLGELVLAVKEITVELETLGLEPLPAAAVLVRLVVTARQAAG
jgi:hypothetical protein